MRCICTAELEKRDADIEDLKRQVKELAALAQAGAESKAKK
jgi:hypothetical protein